ncbi:hypothetical protein [Streptomyces sp. JNUCC 63]
MPASTDTHRATAYHVLARLGRVEPRLALSDADCNALADLVVPWLERDATSVSVMRALTSGLPEVVHAPHGFVARRLRDKLPPPPVPVSTPTPESAPHPDIPAPRPGRLMPECAECGVPGRSAAFVGGLCRGCRTAADTPSARQDIPSITAPAALRQDAVAQVRAALAARDELTRWATARRLV